MNTLVLTSSHGLRMPTPEGCRVQAESGGTAERLLLKLRSNPTIGQGYKKAIIMIGGNDLCSKKGLHKVNPLQEEEQLIQNLLSCRRILKERVPEVTVCTLLNRPIWGPRMQYMIRRVNARLCTELHKLGEEALIIHKALSKKEKHVFLDDLVHLKPKAYRRLAALLAENAA